MTFLMWKTSIPIYQYEKADNVNKGEDVTSPFLSFASLSLFLPWAKTKPPFIPTGSRRSMSVLIYGYISLRIETFKERKLVCLQLTTLDNVNQLVSQHWCLVKWSALKAKLWKNFYLWIRKCKTWLWETSSSNSKEQAQNTQWRWPHHPPRSWRVKGWETWMLRVLLPSLTINNLISCWVRTSIFLKSLFFSLFLIV